MTNTANHTLKLFWTTILVAALGYAMSLALPSPAGAATGHVAATPRRVASMQRLTVKAIAATTTTCRLRVISPAGAETDRVFVPHRRELTWKLRVRAAAAGGRWTIATDCDGLGPTSSTEVTVIAHGSSQTLATLPAPRQSGALIHTTTNGPESADKGVQIAAPAITWSAVAENGTTRATQVQFDFSRGSSFECAVDGQPFASCQSPFITNDLANGSHTFRVRAVSERGQSQATMWQWTSSRSHWPFAGNYDTDGTCEGYAYAMRPDIFDSTTHHDGSWFPATWTGHARDAGYVVDHNPQAGDIAIWPAGFGGSDKTGGHAAFVEQVNADGSVSVSEKGVSGTTGVVHDTLDAAFAAHLWFIHKHA